jgi:positive regulator of sigma E activity
MSQTDCLLEAFAKWHVSVLVLFLLFFVVCALLGLLLLITGRGSPVMLLILGTFGTIASGKAIVRKYAKELAESRAEQEKLNS